MSLCNGYTITHRKSKRDDGMELELLQALAEQNERRIVLVVLDGVGDLPVSDRGGTPLEVAYTPNLDQIASRSICGMADPVGYGITPGSGPGHLSLFGYDPLQYTIGRGVLEALGIGFHMEPQDVAARANFATSRSDGTIVDRRAGRISTDASTELVTLLQREIPHVRYTEIILRPGKEHRFVLVLRGENLDDGVTDTDPQKTGMKPKEPEATRPEAEETVLVVKEFIDKARLCLEGKDPANMVLLRGFSKYPSLPTLGELYHLTAGAIATYPMYRGLARLAGMTILETGEEIVDEFTALARHWREYDFFFVHVKQTDKAGEDGDFDTKIAVLEEFDRHLTMLLELKPDVLIITGDHSTPIALKSHSWHAVPFLLMASTCRPDGVEKFSERACRAGGLGRFPTVATMRLGLAHALKLKKYGA
jgi:2,3-bisphosphoglycerate-independent phosphoglycerate mutase